MPEERLSWLRGLVRQARCAALLQTALLAGGSSRGTKYARQMWKSRERADLIIARVGRVLVLGHVSLAGALPWPWPRGSLLLCASAEGQMVRLTPGPFPRALLHELVGADARGLTAEGRSSPSPFSPSPLTRCCPSRAGASV